MEVLLRLPDGKILAEKLYDPAFPENYGKIRCPGGGIENKRRESPLNALHREMREEYGIRLQPDYSPPTIVTGPRGLVIRYQATASTEWVNRRAYGMREQLVAVTEPPKPWLSLPTTTLKQLLDVPVGDAERVCDVADAWVLVGLVRHNIKTAKDADAGIEVRVGSLASARSALHSLLVFVAGTDWRRFDDAEAAAARLDLDDAEQTEQERKELLLPSVVWSLVETANQVQMQMQPAC